MTIRQPADRPAAVWPAAVWAKFFAAARPDFGLPPASATGVYLEWRIEAWDLARSLKHAARTGAFRKSILAGLRALRQLWFRHPSDMFHVSKRLRVLVALRTATNDTTVRIDNVQHGLMAIHRILDLWPGAEFRA